LGFFQAVRYLKDGCQLVFRGYKMTRNKTEKDLIEHIKSIKQNLAENNFNRADVLDVNYECRADGTITEITLVLTTGGPHIELKLVAEAFNGYWGTGEVHHGLDEHFDSDKEALEMVAQLRDYYLEIGSGVVLER